MYKRILVATDGSTLSKKAVTSAISLAALCGAELVAVKITPRYPQSYFEGSLPLSQTEVSKLKSNGPTPRKRSSTRLQNRPRPKV